MIFTNDMIGVIRELKSRILLEDSTVLLVLASDVKVMSEPVEYKDSSRSNEKTSVKAETINSAIRRITKMYPTQDKRKMMPDTPVRAAPVLFTVLVLNVFFIEPTKSVKPRLYTKNTISKAAKTMNRILNVETKDGIIDSSEESIGIQIRRNTKATPTKEVNIIDVTFIRVSGAL